MTGVVAVVVSHESAGVIGACLDALAREGVPAIVVDNASTDSTRDIAAAKGARLIANPRNEGYGRATTAGIRAAESAAYCLIVNPDVVLDPGAVARLVDAAERWPDAALVAPRLIEPDGRVFHPRRSLLSPPHLNAGRESEPTGPCCAPFLSGACLLARREAFLAVGGFDPAIFLFYEDDDLCRRLRDAGHALILAPDAIARHARGRSAEPTRERVRRSRWHQAWSRGYVARKHGVYSGLWTLMLTNGVKAAGAALMRDGAGVARYGGSAAGAVAFLSGRSALDREGLPPL